MLRTVLTIEADAGTKMATKRHRHHHHQTSVVGYLSFVMRGGNGGGDGREGGGEAKNRNLRVPRKASAEAGLRACRVGRA